MKYSMFVGVCGGKSNNSLTEYFKRYLKNDFLF